MHWVNHNLSESCMLTEIGWRSVASCLLLFPVRLFKLTSIVAGICLTEYACSIIIFAFDMFSVYHVNASFLCNG